MQETKHGGARNGAGRHHEHEQYLVVEVVDFYGDKDMLLAGPVLLANGNPSKTVEPRARSIMAHHVAEGARSVRLLRRWCCIPQESEVVE